MHRVHQLCKKTKPILNFTLAVYSSLLEPDLLGEVIIKQQKQVHQTNTYLKEAILAKIY